MMTAIAYREGVPAQLFREMADRIDRNASAEFGGAILLVPPKGEPVAVLLVDPAQDIEHFWSTCEAKVKLAQIERLQAIQGTTPLGWR